MKRAPLKLSILTQIQIQHKIHLNMRQPDSTTHIPHCHYSSCVMCSSCAPWKPLYPASVGPPGRSYLPVSASWSSQVLTGNELETSSFNNGLTQTFFPWNTALFFIKRGQCGYYNWPVEIHTKSEGLNGVPWKLCEFSIKYIFSCIKKHRFLQNGFKQIPLNIFVFLTF